MCLIELLVELLIELLIELVLTNESCISWAAPRALSVPAASRHRAPPIRLYLACGALHCKTCGAVHSWLADWAL
jgi:hypothetical protein